jgi:hypothetical protein
MHFVQEAVEFLTKGLRGQCTPIASHDTLDREHVRGSDEIGGTKPSDNGHNISTFRNVPLIGMKVEGKRTPTPQAINTLKNVSESFFK